MGHRFLFASIHSHLDPLSGAVLATRELLELLAGRGWDCRAFTCGVIDYQNETPIENVLASVERPTARSGAALSRGGEAEVFDLEIAENREPQYVTFINPQPEKGATVFARIALELGRRRLDIPLLVVEGRGTADGLAGLPVDLSGLTNLHRMANTPDPRDFYRVSRVVLMPSLWRESLGRVPIEAMANGIPVLASDRGALPETLGDAGFVFTVPDRCTPASSVVPTSQEVAPWVAVIERLWDDPEFEAEHRRRALAEAKRWDGDKLAEQYEGFFQSSCRGGARLSVRIS